MKHILGLIFLCIITLSTTAYAQPPNGLKPDLQIPSTVRYYPCWDNDKFIKHYLLPEKHSVLAMSVTKTHVHAVTINKRGEVTYFVKNIVGDLKRTCVIMRTQPNMERALDTNKN